LDFLYQVEYGEVDDHEKKKKKVESLKEGKKQQNVMRGFIAGWTKLLNTPRHFAFTVRYGKVKGRSRKKRRLEEDLLCQGGGIESKRGRKG